MSMLRTRRLFAHRVSALRAFETAYTVPAGRRAIVRDVQIYNAAASDSTLSLLRITAISAGGIYVDVLRGARVSGAGVAWQGDVVLEAGDRIECYSDVAGMNFWCSGAELVIPA